MKVLLSVLPAFAAAAAASGAKSKSPIIQDVTATKPLVSPAAFGATTAVAAPGSPNILILMVDDLGYGDVSFSAGVGSSPDIDTANATPNLAALAAEGVVLTSFYAQPSCTPSRASFLTGKYTTSIGLQDSVIHATEPRGLSLDEDILPQRLAAAGYRTMGVGKYHIGFHQPQYLPTQRGFEEYFGILTGFNVYL
jgi:arylsulfatase I/J